MYVKVSKGIKCDKLKPQSYQKNCRNDLRIIVKIIIIKIIIIIITDINTNRICMEFQRERGKHVSTCFCFIVIFLSPHERHTNV